MLSAVGMSFLHTRFLLVFAVAVAGCGESRAETSPPSDEGDAARSSDGGVPDGSCHNTSDCPGGEDEVMCYGPVSLAEMCIACGQGSACTSDSQCHAGNVCSAGGSGDFNVSCSDGGTFCFPACEADSECNYWQACTSGHCVALPCDKCPAYLSCTSGACAPTTCTSDKECPGGFCVDGACFGTLGSCTAVCG